MLQGLEWVGRGLPRLDGKEIAVGDASYGVDKKLSGLLYGKIKRSPHAHAEICRIDAQRAMALPGVKAVITSRDLPNIVRGSPVGASRQDYPTLARGRVRFIGEPVAAVAAESPETAEEAIELIDIEYRELPVIFDPEEAMAEKPPVIIHPDLDRYEVVQKRPFYISERPEAPNVSSHLKIRVGDIEEGLRSSDIIVENRFTTPSVQHCHLEPVSVTAKMEGDGSMSIWTSSQHVDVQRHLSALLGIPHSKLAVIAHQSIGGGFGNREGLHVEAICAFLAKKCSGAVKISFTREEVFSASSVRHPSIFYIKDGVKKDGEILAREIKAIFNGGAYSPVGEGVVRNSAIASISSYNIPNLKIDIYRVYTNQCPAGAMRGFGGPQTEWAIETEMDVIARRLGMSPIELRQKNLLKDGEQNALGETMRYISSEECLEAVARVMDSSGARALGHQWRIGRGFAVGEKWSHANDPNTATVRYGDDGMLDVYAGIIDIGQGARTALAQIAAHELRIPIEQVRIMPVSSAETPRTSGAAGSRQTFNTGNAIRLACLDLLKKIRAAAAEKLRVPEGEIEISDGKIFRDGRLSMSMQDLVRQQDGLRFVGHGSWQIESGLLDSETGRCSTDVVVSHYTSAAAAARVAVNTETGQVRLLRLVCAVDVGKAINPLLVEGQIQGGMAMATGFALSEEFRIENGVPTNPDLKDYRILGSLDYPRLEAVILERPHPWGPYGGKGCGEASVGVTAPAITNAIFDAIKVPVTDLPATAEKILKVLREMRVH